MAVFVFPDVARMGLGNMLFPWARAEVLAARYGTRILAPRWAKPRLGPVLRKERDKRFYLGLFDNRRAGYIRGVRRALIMSRAVRIPYAQADSFMASSDAKSGLHILECGTWEGWFEGLLPHRELISRRLDAILSSGVRRRLAEADTAFEIAVHVRRGDKAPIPFGRPMTGEATETLPEQWYINAIRSVRDALGTTARVRVFSDAKAGQIDSILAEPGVTRSADNPSIVDMLLLAKARVLITTGLSSFSAWASFLGAMPTIWYPGSGMPLIEAKPALSIETDLDGRINGRGAELIIAASR